VADTTQETMKQAGNEAANQAAGMARTVGEAVGQRVEQVADRSKVAGAEAVAGLGRTASALADSMEDQAPAVADYVRTASEKMDQLANDLRNKKVGDLLNSAAEFGRAQPLVLLAGAALVGFALSRLVKAGVTTSTASKTTEGSRESRA